MEAKNKKKENGQEGIILSGKADLEEFFKKSFVTLLDWRAGYEMPLKKRGGFPSLDMAEFKAWANEYGVADIDPKKITNDQLEVAARRKRFAEMEDRPLNNIDEICEFTDKDKALIISWNKSYMDCPIKKTDRIYSVNTRPLCVWLNKHGIEFGRGHHGRSTY